MKRLILFVLLSLPANALTLADYPSMFFTPNYNATIVLPDVKDTNTMAAINLLTRSLPRYHIRDNQTVLAATETQVKNSVINASELATLNRRAIIIGTPCNNKWVRMELPHIPCTSALADGEARIIASDRPPRITIAGADSAITTAALRYLQESPVQYHARELILRQDGRRLTTTAHYQDVSEPAFSIQNRNATILNNHKIRTKNYGMTVLP